MAGMPVAVLMRAVGHRSPIMTARYSEFADSLAAHRTTAPPNCSGAVYASLWVLGQAPFGF